jgi:hypothetical protein
MKFTIPAEIVVEEVCFRLGAGGALMTVRGRVHPLGRQAPGSGLEVSASMPVRGKYMDEVLKEISIEFGEMVAKKGDGDLSNLSPRHFPPMYRKEGP